jgi:pyridoxine kinase
MFPLQRLGAEVWAVNTVQYSNHPGYGSWTGQVATGAEVSALVDGIAARGALAGCDAVLSGYMGESGIGEAIVGAVRLTRQANPGTLYCCDPVMGDAGRLYVRPDIPALIAGRCVPQADLLTPNQFELEQLTGGPCRTRPAVRAAIAGLRGRMASTGPRVVLVTSLRTDDTPADALDMVGADAHGTSLVRMPLLPIAPSGAGDATAALFLFHYLRSGRADLAMSAAASAIHGVLRRTAEAGSREMLLIAAQDELVSPSLPLIARKY